MHKNLVKINEPVVREQESGDIYLVPILVY